MPESGSVVKALEMQFKSEHGPREHIRSCSRGYVIHSPPGSPIAECPDPYCEAVRSALPLAREQRALLRAYIESHLVARQVWAMTHGGGEPKQCSCTLCERTRKVLP